MIMSPTVFADDDITVYLNEDELIFEQSPIIQKRFNACTVQSDI